MGSVKSGARHGFVALLAVLFLLAGCITTYRDFPAPGMDGMRIAQPVPFSYSINKLPAFSWGVDPLQRTFESSVAFSAITRIAEGDVPHAGLYGRVTLAYRFPSPPAALFGYISAITLTLLPAFSTRDGYTVDYTLFSGGVEAHTYHYEITRKIGVWILLLPLAWVNLFTASEEEAFTATAQQFVQDAARDGYIPGASPGKFLPGAG